MIENDEQLKAAQEAVRNLQQILLAARKVHSAIEYRAMSEPILLELQATRTRDSNLPESC